MSADVLFTHETRDHACVHPRAQPKSEQPVPALFLHLFSNPHGAKHARAEPYFPHTGMQQRHTAFFHSLTTSSDTEASPLHAAHPATFSLRRRHASVSAGIPSSATFPYIFQKRLTNKMKITLQGLSIISTFLMPALTLVPPHTLTCAFSKQIYAMYA